jgi:hypothetical protein
MADLSTVFDLLHDALLEIHNASTEPDAVRMHAADGLAQIDEGRRLLSLEPEGGAM